MALPFSPVSRSFLLIRTAPPYPTLFVSEMFLSIACQIKYNGQDSELQ